MRKILSALATASFIATSAPSIAAPCRNAHGAFVKCSKPAAKPGRCKDAKGKFAKCGTKGTKRA